MRMALEFIGKVSPLPGEIQKAVDDGFKKCELYMREEFLTDRHLKFLSDATRESGIKFYSIHTPHSKPDNFLEVLERTKEFARRASIPVIVVHSSLVNELSKKILEKLEGKMFVENELNYDLPFLEKIFKKGVRICLDTSHFYTASRRAGRDFYEDLGTLFKKNAKFIGHMHIADADEDGRDVDIGDGEIDFFKVMPIVSKYYKGVAVVETAVNRQLKDSQKLKKIMSESSRRKS